MKLVPVSPVKATADLRGRYAESTHLESMILIALRALREWSPVVESDHWARAQAIGHLEYEAGVLMRRNVDWRIALRCLDQILQPTSTGEEVPSPPEGGKEE